MTFSIIAHDEQTGHIGIAVASKFFAAGAREPFIRTGVGAIASQARSTNSTGREVWRCWRRAPRPPTSCACSSPPTSGQDIRQVHVMDRQGRFAAHTGEECLEWCGHL